MRMASPVLCALPPRNRVVELHPTRELAKAVRGMYWGGGGGAPSPSAGHLPGLRRV
jgi:hypothetical protein